MADNELFPGTGSQGKTMTDECFCSIVRITDVFLKYLYHLSRFSPIFAQAFVGFFFCSTVFIVIDK